MKTLIVSRTRMGTQVCVGGLVLDGNHSIRIVTPDSHSLPADAPYRVGQLWDLNFTKSQKLAPPHIEDVIVKNAIKVGDQPNIEPFLLSRIKCWRGSPEILFDGKLQFSPSGSGYISRPTGIPSNSTGYWISDLPLIKHPRYADKYYYAGTKPFLIAYVGTAPQIEMLNTGTLIRVSLARWWVKQGEVEERCYLQISGWYGENASKEDIPF